MLSGAILIDRLGPGFVCIVKKGQSVAYFARALKGTRLMVGFKRISNPGRWGDSHMKVTGMLVVSLRGVNCRFWSQGVQERKSIFLLIQV